MKICSTSFLAGCLALLLDTSNAKALLRGATEDASVVAMDFAVDKPAAARALQAPPPTPNALVINMNNTKSTGGTASFTLFLSERASTSPSVQVAAMTFEIPENYRNRYFVLEPDMTVEQDGKTLGDMDDPVMYLELAELSPSEPSTLAYTGGPTNNLKPGQQITLNFQPVMTCDEIKVVVALSVSGNVDGRTILRLELFQYDKALADGKATLVAMADSVLPPGETSTASVPLLPDLSLVTEPMQEPDMYLVITGDFCNSPTRCEREPRKFEPMFGVQSGFTYQVNLRFTSG